MSAYIAILWLWGIWILSWIAAAAWSNRTEARPRFGSELVYRTVTLAGFVLLFVGRFGPRLCVPGHSV